MEEEDEETGGTGRGWTEDHYVIMLLLDVMILWL